MPNTSTRSCALDRATARQDKMQQLFERCHQRHRKIGRRTEGDDSILRLENHTSRNVYRIITDAKAANRTTNNKTIENKITPKQNTMRQSKEHGKTRPGYTRNLVKRREYTQLHETNMLIQMSSLSEVLMRYLSFD